MEMTEWQKVAIEQRRIDNYKNTLIKYNWYTGVTVTSMKKETST